MPAFNLNHSLFVVVVVFVVVVFVVFVVFVVVVVFRNAIKTFSKEIVAFIERCN